MVSPFLCSFNVERFDESFRHEPPVVIEWLESPIYELVTRRAWAVLLLVATQQQEIHHGQEIGISEQFEQQQQ